MKARFEALGALVVGNPPAEFGKSIAVDVARWQRIAKFASISSD